MSIGPSQTAAGKPKRGWFRFTLRTLLIATAVVGLACAWLGSHLSRQHRQRRIVGQLQARGHTVHYDYSTDLPLEHFRVREERNPPGPWLLRRCFGDDLFADVAFVSLTGKHVRDDFRELRELPELTHVWGDHLITDPDLLADIARIPKLRSLNLEAPGEILDQILAAQDLETLTLIGANIRDADLQVLCRLPKLQHLRLVRVQLTAVGMEHVSRVLKLRSLEVYEMSIDDDALGPIGRLVNLEELFFQQANLTDDGIRHLRALTDLKSLDLRAVHITDAGLEHLAGLVKLRELTVSGDNVSDAGLRLLTNLQALETLDLSGSPVTDEGMKSLSQLRQLRVLYMPFSTVTDAGIGELRTLQRLESLTVGQHVTPAAAAKLREHLPTCRISGRDAHGHYNFELP